MRLSESDWCRANNPEFLFENGGAVISKRQKYLWGIACIRSVAHLFPPHTVWSLIKQAERYIDSPEDDEVLLGKWSKATGAVRSLAAADRGPGSLIYLVLYAAGIGSEPDWHAVHIMMRQFSLTKERWEKGGWPGPFPAGPGETVRPRSSLWQAKLVRNIVGNPYTIACINHLNPWKRSRAYTLVPPPLENGKWRTPQVTRLAECAYHERRGNGQLDGVCLLALADALEEVGLGDGVGEAVIMALRGEEGCSWCEGGGRKETPYGWDSCGHCKGTGMVEQIERYRGFWPVDWVLGKE